MIVWKSLERLVQQGGHSVATDIVYLAKIDLDHGIVVCRLKCSAYHGQGPVADVTSISGFQPLSPHKTENTTISRFNSRVRCITEFCLIVDKVTNITNRNNPISIATDVTGFWAVAPCSDCSLNHTV